MKKKIVPKIYVVYALGFVTLPFLLSIILLFPYPPFNLLNQGNVYYSLKPYGLQIFGSKAAMWGFMGVLSAALGILIGFAWQDRERVKKMRFLIKSLKEEVRRNIGQLFTGEVERPFNYDIIDTISKDFSDFIYDHNRMREIAALYDELRYYQEIVKYWRVFNPNDIVTERHLGACINYIHYFENEKAHAEYYKIITTPNDDSWQNKRTRAIKIKESNINNWEKKLNSELKKIFKVNSIDKLED